MKSKMFLLTSGIHTPKSEVVNLQSCDFSNRSCIFATQALPLVVKLLRAGCGFGTFTVKTEMERSRLVTLLAMHKARRTTEVLLSQYIDIVQDLSVHFVKEAPGTAHDRDSPLILGVTVHVHYLGRDGKWPGGQIDYSM